HGAHYFAYASYTVPVFTGVVAALDDTPWELIEGALARLKLYLMHLRFYGNLLDVPFSMHGRHPFSGGRIRASMYRQMAEAGPGEGEADFDAELAAAHLRLPAEEPEEPPFEGRDVSAEAPPQGSLTMPYAGITAHRRDDWLVCAHAFGRYFWGTEIYANVNAFGAFIGAGALTILRGGEPISLAGSGYVAEGWDWARFDGITAPDLPLDELRNPKNGTQHTRTPHTFAGGLTHRGMHGCLVHRTEGPEWAAPGLHARKTYFLLGDRVIALGSGIAADEAEHPVLTNLFQRHLSEPEVPIVADGERLTGSDVERELPRDRASWLIDTVGTGFLVAAGQPVHVARRHQLSRDKDDTKDTEGDFASAWIDHGTAPEGGAYEYAIIVNATPERMAALAEAADAGDAPWRVLRRDERAHIVRDEPTGITACVLFEPGEIAAELPVTSVDRPCLLMLEADGDGWWLSISDADLNLQDHVSVPRELGVTLRGRWRLEDAPGEISSAAVDDEATILTVRCHDGAGFACRLAPPP
ncbi:MAG: polysaccharide lyase family 8 super-sandwich domain-containing protein, partial [Gemmatimonadota bacterium]|nr:polysaccharide lyase family 8 super-sandwich domain-containing protein [Gemmatimonadota bacterium]